MAGAPNPIRNKGMDPIGNEGMDHEVSAKAIANIAAAIPDLQRCFLLAAQLGYSKVEMLSVNSFDAMTAQTILNKWVGKKGKGATSLALYNALVDIDLALVAEEYAAMLRE